MRGGDIAVLSLESTVPSVSKNSKCNLDLTLNKPHCKFEIEGTVEPGIMAASWSPDDSLLVLVTG